MNNQTSFGSTTGHIAFPGAHVETGGTLNVTVSDGHPPAITAQPNVVIPFERNDGIINRPNIFTKLEGLLPPVAEYQSAALWGLGGSGKTQIALEFAYRRFREISCAVYWVHADNEATFTQDYETLARRAGLTGKFHGKELLGAVREWIEAQPCWLLIVDNADNLGIFGVQGVAANTQHGQKSNEDVCLYDYIPRAPFGTVLWTSRDERIVGTLVGAQRGLPVGRMMIEEATALFKASTNQGAIDNEEQDAISELLRQLDHHALAVSQAAAYIRITSMPVAKYLSRLTEGKKRWKILKRSEHDRHRRREVPNSILETWSISMEQIRQEGGTAYQLLLTLAYVHNQNIPHTLVRAAAQASKEQDLQSVDSKRTSSSTDSEDESDDDEDEVVTAVARLREFSFLSMHKHQSLGKTYEMHKLVQDAARYSLSLKSRRSDAARFSKAALRYTLCKFPGRGRETWELGELWLPHALQSSEWAEACNSVLEKDILTLLGRVSYYLLDRGRWHEKELVDKKTYTLRLSIYGDRHHETLFDMAKLGTTYHFQGRYDDSERMYTKVLKLQQEVLGKMHPDTLAVMASLAATYYVQGRYGESENISLEVLDLHWDVLGKRHPDTLSNIANLATTYLVQGRFNDAENIYKEVLELRREILGKRHPDTLRSMASLAATYLRQGRCNEAEDIYINVSESYQDILGKMHPETLATMADLASTYHAQGRYVDAENILKEVLELRRGILGKRHPDTLSSISKLALAIHSQGRYDEAEKSQVEVLHLHEELLGKRHPDTIRSMANLSATYYEQERYNEDENMSVEVLELRKEVLGKRHPDTLTSMANLAVTYRAQAKHKKAEEIEMEILELRQGGLHLDNRQPNVA
ncbi:hypothetical protein EsH8_VII_000146 [Colletotrichum jinshuiense]